MPKQRGARLPQPGTVLLPRGGLASRQAVGWATWRPARWWLSRQAALPDSTHHQVHRSCRPATSHAPHASSWSQESWTAEAEAGGRGSRVGGDCKACQDIQKRQPVAQLLEGGVVGEEELGRGAGVGEDMEAGGGAGGCHACQQGLWKATRSTGVQ